VCKLSTAPPHVHHSAAFSMFRAVTHCSLQHMQTELDKGNRFCLPLLSLQAACCVL
jgi:hypothetical protein